MKKLSVILVAALALFSQTVSAQTDQNLFNHLGAGLSVGTDGIGIEVATPITSHFAARLGYSFMPGFKYSTTEDFSSTNHIFQKESGTGYYDEVEIEGKLHIGDFKLLFDYYPSKTGSFHVTAGAYIGQSKLAEVKTLNHFINSMYHGNSGPELGTATQSYTVVSDNEGHVNVDLKVNSFKPYLGFGFGRAVPTNRINVAFDLGVQFWGKPGLHTTISDNIGKSYQKVDKDKIINDEDYCDDIVDAIDIMEKISVYPVLKLRINGRIF